MAKEEGVWFWGCGSLFLNGQHLLNTYSYTYYGSQNKWELYIVQP